MTMCHIIKPDGTVASSEYNGKLEYKCIPFSSLREIIGAETIEHVTVLWKGKKAHMFVDEDGLAHQLPMNWKASGIYSNAELSRLSPTHSKIYNDLTQDPQNTQQAMAWAGFVIVGTAVLWEGDME